jgi:DNA helicase-2/ATP-dependent DNA helicase PcrA
MAWSDDLDPQSPAHAIAADESRYIRVVAGPGTGKSFALKRRVARLLETGVRPQRILAVTFTKVAAEDLHRELRGMEVPGCDSIKGGTLHSICMGILSRQNVVEATGRVARPLNRFELEPLLYDLSVRFGDKRERNKRIKAYESAWARLQHEQPGVPRDEIDSEFERILLAWLRFHEGMLIGEIIPMAHEYLRLNPAAPERRLYDHILVDEYQDLNRAEQAVIDLLGEHANMCIVGDDDQSLYSFKHAHPAGIRTFHDSHNGTSDHALMDCRRCATHVVEMAGTLIANNVDRINRQLLPFATNGEGEIIPVQFDTLEEEADGIAQFVQRRIDSGANRPEDFLILAQRRAVGNPIHAALAARHIPCKSYYEEGLLDNTEAQERVALLKLFVSRDDCIALRWLLGFGGNNFRAASYARVRAYCEANNITPWDTLEQVADGALQIPHCRPLVQRFNEIREQLAAMIGDGTVADFITKWLPPEFQGVDELRQVAEGLIVTSDSVTAFLSNLIEAISQPDIPPEVAEVRVMSLHKSKGLSSPIVIIAGCVEGLLPSAPDMDLSAVERAARLEEERRVFYVGVTRQKARNGTPGTLVLTCSREMPLADAMQSGIRPARRVGRRAFLIASRFIAQLGNRLRATLTGAQFSNR